MNGIENVKIARLSSEEFSQAFLKTRSFQRLKDAAIDLSEYDFGTVLVDPPRQSFCVISSIWILAS